MSYLQMPVRSDVPSYDFQLTLEGTIYNFEFNWNDRGGYWTMDIRNANDVEILTGVKMVSGYPLVGNYIQQELPLGEFYCIDTASQNKSPGIDDFGDRVLLIYRESTTDDTDFLVEEEEDE